MNTELYREKLERLNEDEHMLNAIHTVFLECINKEIPSDISTLSNQVLGEKFRAFVQASKILDTAYKVIRSYENKKVDVNNINKGK